MGLSGHALMLGHAESVNGQDLDAELVRHRLLAASTSWRIGMITTSIRKALFSTS